MSTIARMRNENAVRSTARGVQTEPGQQRQAPPHHEPGDMTVFAVGQPTGMKPPTDTGDPVMQALMARPAAGAPIQRKVAMVNQDKDDWVILSNAKYAKTLAGGAITVLEGGDYSDMEAGEKLAILGHGSAGSIRGQNAQTIVNHITNGDKAMPKLDDDNKRKVMVMSCNAGKKTDDADAGSTLVHGIAAKLKAKGYKASVEGMPSLALTHEEVGRRGVKEDKKGDFSNPRDESEYWHHQHALVKKHGLGSAVVGRVPPKIKSVTELLKGAGKSEHEIGGMSLSDKVDWTSARTGDFYKELIADTDKEGILHDAGTGMVSATTDD